MFKTFMKAELYTTVKHSVKLLRFVRTLMMDHNIDKPTDYDIFPS